MLFSLETIVFAIFFCIIKNPLVSVWYYHLPFLSNIETQVRSIGSLTDNIGGSLTKNCVYSLYLNCGGSLTYNFVGSLTGGSITYSCVDSLTYNNNGSLT